ncbi:MAG: T9SS type A sorting domain-containing protein [candidate division Zixibacteria bacterium]|nr:T9SS type A sorting domain-containing protein [candidate division Zixibacteria bacterium]MDH3938413.1 T9SS type A sorting domain-containing protein [candidate division Zixibacteria bacterium]MDH4035254.1 T9SS type A sorting domain-containing protein [candidate division Zixibacteria bacterium]
MNQIKVLTFCVILLVAGSVTAQVDGYTCTNSYLDCADVVESETDSVWFSSFLGNAASSFRFFVSLSVSDTVHAFQMLIDWDDTYMQPRVDPDDSAYLFYRLLGQFESADDDFVVQISPNPADNGAILVSYNLATGDAPPLPPGNHGTIFRLLFDIDPAMPFGAVAEFNCYQVNEYIVTDSALMEAFCADCRRTNLAVSDGAGGLETSYPTCTGGSYTVQYPLGEIHLSGTDGLVGGAMPILGGPSTFHFGYENYDQINNVKGMANGFELSASGGVTWTALHGDEFTFDPLVNFDLGWAHKEHGWNGAGADTLGIIGARDQGGGLPPGYNGPGIYIGVDITDDSSYVGEQFCIDSCFFRPGGTWMWAYGSAIGGPPAYWDGPHCFELILEPPLEWVVAPVSYAGDHCDSVVLDYEATSSESPVLTFTNEGNFGNVAQTGDNTCQFTYQPTLADVGALLVAVIGVSDGVSPMVTTTTNLTFTNQAPTIICDGGQVPIGPGNTGSTGFTIDDVDCDPSTVSLGAIDPTPVGIIYLDGNEIVFETEPEDGGANGSVFTVEVCVSDGVDENCCVVEFTLLGCEAFEVQIEKTHGTLQGLHELVDIRLTRGASDMAGFNLMIAYDASALNFQAAIPGEFHTICRWEYFNYRFGPNGNCGSACPSGMLEVLALAETNNGPNHPLCLNLDLPAVLVSLDFLVSDDRTLECQYAPIRFFWTNCTDNSIAYHPADDPMAAVQGVSRRVYDFDLIGRIEDMYTGYPTYTGFQEECLDGADPDKPKPIQYVDFVNGGIDIVCADSIDDRGDVNLNGTSNEIADAVLFSNYFVQGIGVFNVNYPGQVAATDVNADGLTLSVADLVYLIRIITGDAPPYPKIAPVSVLYAWHDGVLSVEAEMAAAFVVLKGNVKPVLLAENMEMDYAFDGRNTRVLISKIERGAGFEGDFLAYEADLVSVEFATYEGAPVAKRQMLGSYSLYQNYPNPFNPKTTLSFDLPRAGDYNLSIYNVAGRKVASFAGSSIPGTVSFEWDASDMASGVYFYKLETGDYTATRKMVLMK